VNQKLAGGHSNSRGEEEEEEEEEEAQEKGRKKRESVCVCERGRREEGGCKPPFSGSLSPLLRVTTMRLYNEQEGGVCVCVCVCMCVCVCA